MLRVRPILHTPHAAEWATLFTAVGLGEIVVAGSERASTLGVGTGRCFAAGAGRIMLCEAAAFGIGLGFEVRDVQKFADWTINDGTPVFLRTENAGNESVTVAEIVAPDGVAFSARPVDPAIAAGTPGTDGPGATALAVVAWWHTHDVQGATSTLENIGAKPEAASAATMPVRYRAKHGGYVDVREGSAAGIDFGFEYSGDASALDERLVLAGYEAIIVEKSPGGTLLVGHPDGGRLEIVCNPALGNSNGVHPVGF